MDNIPVSMKNINHKINNSYAEILDSLLENSNLMSVCVVPHHLAYSRRD